MTDDPSKIDGAIPDDAQPTARREAEGKAAPVRSFGRRPEFARAATVLSHNFRAPIVADETMPDTVQEPEPHEMAESHRTDDKGTAAGTDDTAAASTPVHDDAPENAGENRMAPATDPVTDTPPKYEQEPESEANHLGTEQPPDDAEDSAEADLSVAGAEADAGADATVGELNAGAAAAAGNPDPQPDRERVDDGLPDSANEDALPVDSDGVSTVDGNPAGTEALIELELELELEPEPEPEPQPEPIAGSLLEIPVRDDPQAESGEEGGRESGGDVEGSKREILFDGTDEPLGPRDDDVAGAEVAELPEPPPADIAPPPDEAALARELRISFRDGQASAAELALQRSREEAEVARKLGIRFRDGDGDGVIEGADDELSDAAQRLGIRFRDPDEVGSTKKKASMTGRLIMLITLFSGLAGIVMLLFYGEPLFKALFG